MYDCAVYIYIICALYLSVYTCSHTCICISLFAHTQHVLKVEISPNTSGRTPCGSATAWPLAVKLPAAAPFDALRPLHERAELMVGSGCPILGILQTGQFNGETGNYRNMGLEVADFLRQRKLTNLLDVVGYCAF